MPDNRTPTADPNVQQPGQTPGSTPQPDRPDWVDPLLSALQGQTEKIEHWSREVIRSRPAEQPQPAAPQAPAPPDTDALQSIAADGWRAVDARVEQRAQEIANKTLREQLGAWIQQEVPERAATNESQARAQVDAQFGPGTFDEVLKPELDKAFGDRVLDRAAIQQYRTSVEALKGRHFDTLTERRAKFEADTKAKQEEAQRVNAPWMPGPGFQVVPENELSEDDQTKLGAMRKARMKTPTDEEAAKLRDLMLERGPDGVSFDDFLEAFPAKPQATA